MTANSTEAETDRAIPLDKLSSRVGDQTGREGYVVFVLNIGRAINISHTTSEAPHRDPLPEGEGTESGCLAIVRDVKDRVDHGFTTQVPRQSVVSISANRFPLPEGEGSRGRGSQAKCGLRPDTKWLTSLNPGVEACPGVTSESINASSSAVIFTACALV